MPEYYIGLMSGTSMDAIDAALIDCSHNTVKLVAHHSQTLSNELRSLVNELCLGCDNELEKTLSLDIKLGLAFAESANTLLKANNINAKDIVAIGSHGQTIRHYPDASIQNSLQIADPNTIAEQTGITTVADFRRRDMAAGGQGAPLVPAFHSQVFRHDKKNTVVLNIGGIANITVLPSDRKTNVIGFDTGPGNGLMDAWINKNKQLNFDDNGNWAASGKVQEALLKLLLDEPYFSLSFPKSTGRELFNQDWLDNKLEQANTTLTSEDIQSTLCELTAVSISNAIQSLGLNIDRMLVCGGGAKNSYLINRIQFHLLQYEVSTTETVSMDPEWIEAMAFAWLAKQTLNKQPGNIASVTGATHPCILGAVYPA